MATIGISKTECLLEKLLDSGSSSKLSLYAASPVGGQGKNSYSVEGSFSKGEYTKTYGFGRMDNSIEPPYNQEGSFAATHIVKDGEEVK